MQHLIQTAGLNPHDRLLPGDQTVGSQVYGDLQRRLGRALPVAGLEHVKSPLLHGELDILHVAIVGLQLFDDRLELRKDLGKRLFHGRGPLAHFLAGGLGQGLGCADTGDDIFALGIDQKLTVKLRLASGWVARESHASG